MQTIILESQSSGALCTEASGDPVNQNGFFTNAGGFLRFEKQHRDIFVKMLAPKLEDRIPKDVVPLIVEYWVHLGFWVHTRTSAHAH